MFTVRCSQCGAESRVSLIEGRYEGPFRCFGCHGLFRVRVVDNVLRSQEPMNEEELRREQEIEELKKKYRRL